MISFEIREHSILILCFFYNGLSVLKIPKRFEKKTNELLNENFFVFEYIWYDKLRFDLRMNIKIVTEKIRKSDAKFFKFLISK